MDLQRRASDLAADLRRCAGRNGCRYCSLDNYMAGSCADRLKQDAAEMIEDQQAVIQSMSTKLADMIAAVYRLYEKYSVEVKHGQEEKE